MYYWLPVILLATSYSICFDSVIVTLRQFLFLSDTIMIICEAYAF